MTGGRWLAGAALLCWFLLSWTSPAAGLLRPALEAALQGRIARVEEAFALCREGLRLEEQGDPAGAVEAYTESVALAPNPPLRERIQRLSQSPGGMPPRPDLHSLRDRIAELEALLAGRPQTAASRPDPAFPAMPEHDLLGGDDADWEHYPDRPQVETAVGTALSAFRDALRSGDIPAAASHIEDNRRGLYEGLFRSRPEAMSSFADLLEGAGLSFLSAPGEADPEGSTTLRTAEQAVTIDGFTFYIQWIEVDGEWLLFDF